MVNMAQLSAYDRASKNRLLRFHDWRDVRGYLLPHIKYHAILVTISPLSTKLLSTLMQNSATALILR